MNNVESESIDALQLSNSEISAVRSCIFKIVFYFEVYQVVFCSILQCVCNTVDVNIVIIV